MDGANMKEVILRTAECIENVKVMNDRVESLLKSSEMVFLNLLIQSAHLGKDGDVIRVIAERLRKEDADIKRDFIKYRQDNKDLHKCIGILKQYFEAEER